MSKRHFAAAFFIILFSGPLFAQDTTEQVIGRRRNSAAQQDKPYVIMISVDGMCADYAEKFNAKNLLWLSAGGVRATYMKAAYPSLTFPNHYTLVTGLYPAHHGLVDNFFYGRNERRGYQMNSKKEVTNPVWYGGVPLWVLAEQQKMLTASFYWVGSETAVNGVYPTRYYTYNTKISTEDRIQQVADWLRLPADRRPHFITFYFPEVDHEGHYFGPDSKEAGEAVRFVDKSIAKLVEKVRQTRLPVNFIVVSDHGMTHVKASEALQLPAVVDTTKFIVPKGDAVVHLYAKEKSVVKPTYRALKKTADRYDVYLKNEVPAKWHYGTKDDRFNRIGDILLVPRPPYIFNLKSPKTTPGKHGFDPELPDMHAVFMAWGPAFKSGYKQVAFENVDVYPLIARILGLNLTQKTDGKIKTVKGMLK